MKIWKIFCELKILLYICDKSSDIPMKPREVKYYLHFNSLKFI